jgi:tetratricopeptide (TPR) repeat protein
MRLCLAMGGYWWHSSDFAEMQRWFTQAVQRGDGSDSPEMARCLTRLGAVLSFRGDHVQARKCAADALDMMARLQDTTRRAGPLCLLADIAWDQGDPLTARALYKQAVAAARETGRSLTESAWEGSLMWLLLNFAWFEEGEHKYDEAKALIEEALTLAHQHRAGLALLGIEHRLASILQKTGRNHEAVALMHHSIPRALRAHDPYFLITLAEDYATGAAELGDHRLATQLLGAAQAARLRLDASSDTWARPDIDQTLAKTRSQLPDDEWDDLYQTGRNTTLEQLLAAQTQST